MSSLPRKIIRVNAQILIREVKLKPFIYDANEPSHNDSEIRNKAFDEITTIYNTEVKNSTIYDAVTGK